MSSSEATRHGFVGVGAMGAPMVENLLRAGLRVQVFDVRPEPLEQLRSRGAEVAEDLSSLAASSDIIGICVVNDAQLLEVVGGAGGLLEGARPGTILILHSTVGPQTCREVELRCREQGVSVLEVTVSGYTDKARDGVLTLMIGGQQALVDSCDSYLAAIGDRRFLLGEVGAGSVAKLANNVMAILAKIATYEGLAVARANGVDVSAMVDVASVSSGNSDALRQWRDQGLTHDPDPGTWESIRLEGRRILLAARAIAAEQGVQLPVVDAVIQLMSELESTSKVGGEQ